MLIAMRDRLGQRPRRRNHPRGAPAFARQPALAIGSHENALIALPAITEPMQFALVGPFDGARHRLLDQPLAHWSGSVGNHESTFPILYEPSPRFPSVMPASSAVFFEQPTTPRQ